MVTTGTYDPAKSTMSKTTKSNSTDVGEEGRKAGYRKPRRQGWKSSASEDGKSDNFKGGKSGSAKMTATKRPGVTHVVRVAFLVKRVLGGKSGKSGGGDGRKEAGDKGGKNGADELGKGGEDEFQRSEDNIPAASFRTAPLWGGYLG